MDMHCASALQQITMAAEEKDFMRALANKRMAGSRLLFLLFLLAAQAAHSCRGLLPLHARPRQGLRTLMPTARRAAPLNRLLAALPPRLTGRLIAACDAVDLKLGTVLNEADARIAHVYFPTDGFISLMIPVDGASSL